MISTGIKYLDRLTGGLKLGDNVVWQVTSGVPVEYFIRSFFAEKSGFNKSIIYVNFNFSPHTIFKRYDYLFKNRNSILIDAFTHGKGNSDPVFLDFYSDPGHDSERQICIENPKNITSFVSILNEIESGHTDGSFYIFDSLTGMNELWKDEAAVLDFFTFTCPKLYDLNTLAYWIFEKEAHSREFIAGIMHITQIVFSISPSSTDHYELKINKLEDRTSLYGSEPSFFKIIDQDILFQEKKPHEVIGIGEKLREIRREMKITQAELASSLNLTPGAVSQIENDIISPSLNTLVQLSSLFNKPLDYFIDQTPDSNRDYIISKKHLRVTSTSRNAEIYRIIDAGENEIKPHIIILKNGKAVSGPLLLHKGREFISVIAGKLKISIDGKEDILEEGHSLLLKTSFIENFQNLGDTACKFFYILL